MNHNDEKESWLKRVFLGRSRSVSDPSLFRKLSLLAFFAWIGLGADGLSSSCYGPEEAFLALGKHHTLGIFVTLGTVLTIFVISASYHQIIKLFPSGGGGYLVASKLLSPTIGMVSGSALLIDYLLTITLSVASGTDALFSFLRRAIGVPERYVPYEMASQLFCICNTATFLFNGHTSHHTSYPIVRSKIILMSFFL